MKKLLTQWVSLGILFFAINPSVGYGEMLNAKVYRSGNYHFRFEYPSNYSLREGSAGTFIELLLPKQNMLLFQIHDFRTLVDDCSHFGDQTLQPCDTLSCVTAFKAISHCDADSDDGTAYCLGEDVKSEAVTLWGKTGYRFHLIQTEENYQSHTKVKQKIPMILYYIDISSGPNPRILEIYGTEDEPNRTIIETLRFE